MKRLITLFLFSYIFCIQGILAQATLKVSTSGNKIFDEKIETTLIAEELPGGKIVDTKEVSSLKAVEWTLTNGAKVVFRNTDFKENKVNLLAYSEGGSSLYDVDMLPAAERLSFYIGTYGLGDFNAGTLRKLLAGKQISCTVSISGMSESVKGSSTPQNFETMLQLLYLRFEKPRFDKDAHESLVSRERAAMADTEMDPQKIMGDSVRLISNNYHPRTLLYSDAYLDRMDIKNIEQVYRDRIKDASDFTFFIVGNIDEATVKPLVEKYIGSLKSEYRKESWKDNHVRPLKGKVVKVIELETPRTVVLTSFSKEMKYNAYNNVCNTILKEILSRRYARNIPKGEGDCGEIFVNESVSRIPYSNYSISLTYDCNPIEADRLKPSIYAEVEKVIKRALTTEEMSEVISDIKKEREQSKLQNSYWLNAIYSSYISGINPEELKNFDNIINNITPKDIQKFTKALFKDADVMDITFIPKK